MVNVFLIGIAGKMGRMICSYAKDTEGVKIVGGLDAQTSEFAPTFKSADEVNVKPDVIVDFSRPETLDSVISLSDKFNCPVVLATTGYDEKALEKINALTKRRAVLMSGNMSFGVNLITALVEKAAAALGEDFDVEIVEKHHNKKVDAPSGTALMLARSAAKYRSGKTVVGRGGASCKREKGEISISSVRGGTVVGEHDVMFMGDDEVITVSHSALSRRIFAVGAIKAARFLIGKENGLYDMKDVLGL